MIQTDNFLTARHTNVAVMTSGGMDSALLLYLIVKEAAAKGVEVTALTIPGPDGAESHARNIVALVEQLTATSIAHEQLNPSSSSDLRVKKGVVQAVLQRRYDAVFIATTAVPDHLKDLKGVPKRPQVEYPVEQPWILNTKDQIVEYILSQGLEQLITASHSCTVLEDSHCGQCWNCVERRWALG